jgi:hypothetical protein
MVTIKRRVARLAVAPVAAIMFGLAAAILVAAVPVSMFESAVMATGLPQALSIAEPPLGFKARVLAIILAFVAVAALSWLAITPVERALARDSRRRRTPWADDGYPADDDQTSHAPVEQARKPIFAPEELGAPLMSDAALAAVAPVADAFGPDDEALDAPIDDNELLLMPDAEPDAVPDARRAEPQVLEPWVPVTSPTGETSIHALIRRLEAGLAKRGGTDPDPDAPKAAPLALADEWIVDAGTPLADDRRESGEGLKSALFELKRFAWR